jgi:hypothetical protein
MTVTGQLFYDPLARPINAGASLPLTGPGAVVYFVDLNFRQADTGAISESRCYSVRELQFPLDHLEAWLVA